jgi:hypothetical protein
MLAASSSSSPSSYRKSEGSMPAGAKSLPKSTPRYSTKLYVCGACAAQVTEAQECGLQLLS